MIEFILNKQLIKTEDAKGGTSLLDFIRKEMHLTGTKSGCREGDCGACTVLSGELKNDKLVYKTIVSCLTPLVNVVGKHIVTVEGLNTGNLSPVQESIVRNSATQCGFCTPGFVVSLTDFLLSTDNKNVKQSLSGNICRCTGYKSIENTAKQVDDLKQSLEKGSEIKNMIEKGWLPDYFNTIEESLLKIHSSDRKNLNSQIIAGATDLMVQNPEELRSSKLTSVNALVPNTVEVSGSKIFIGAGISISNFFESEILNLYFPGLSSYAKLIASQQIRNMATVGGNIVNASPIGDLSILLLALNAGIILESDKTVRRQLDLSNLFIDYKRLDLKPLELIKFIVIEIPSKSMSFNFEKVSKRTYLDIASVNSAFYVNNHEYIITEIYFSAGGVAPYPKLMSQTCSFLKGKELDMATLNSSLTILQNEISPISDIRGSKEYKRLLIRQLFLRHFLKLFPQYFNPKEVLNLMITNSVL
ncbi:MAG: FAD binding domain-containing protein [Bacteroidota bacterium]